MPRTASVFLEAVENAKSPEDAAVAVGLPHGWKLMHSVTPSGDQVLRIYDLDGTMFPSFEAVQSCHGDSVFPNGSVPSFDLSNKDQDGDAATSGDANEDVPVVGALDLSEKDQDAEAATSGDACEDVPNVGALDLSEKDQDGEAVLGDVSIDCQTKKGSRRARALALGDGDAVVALEKARELLRAAGKVIDERKSGLVEVAAIAETTKRDFEAASAEVREAQQGESEVARRLMELNRRRREAEQQTLAKKKKLDETNAMLLILDMEVARGAANAASQQLATDELARLERVANEAQQVIEEHQQREREARERMKKLLKEQNRIRHLGPFGRRTSAATGTKAIMDTTAVDAKSSTSEGVPWSSATSSTRQATSGACVDASVVKVKREVLEAFGSHRARVREETTPVVISIDDE
jgi:hypothetical protein